MTALAWLLALVGLVAIVALAVMGAAWVLDVLDVEAQTRRRRDTIHAEAIEAAGRINAAAYRAEQALLDEAERWQGQR